MKSLLTTLLLFIPVIAFSTKVLPQCDILYYKNDTLYLDKIYKELLLKKIKQLPDFKPKLNQREENYYTAYWKLEEETLSLLKVIYNNTELLDLKKSFGKKYKTEKVILPIDNEILFLHKPFIVRQGNSWYPTYVEDYELQFEKNRLTHIDTITNYVDLPNRLNRYSVFQLETKLFPILKENIQINLQNLSLNKITFHIIVKLKNDGSLDNVDLSNLYLTNLSDSTYAANRNQEIVNLNAVKQYLKQINWDEIKNANEDDLGFEFEYYPKLNQLSSPQFDNYVNRMYNLEMERIPWFIKDKYDD